jgi:hypothetical protein
MLKLPTHYSSTASRYGNTSYDRYIPPYTPPASTSTSSYTSPYSSAKYTGRHNRYQRDGGYTDDESSSVIMRRREKSIDRSILPTPSINSALTRIRRSSFADTSKYY